MALWAKFKYGDQFFNCKVGATFKKNVTALHDLCANNIYINCLQETTEL